MTKKNWYYSYKVGGYAKNVYDFSYCGGCRLVLKSLALAVDVDGVYLENEARTDYQNAECGINDLTIGVDYYPVVSTV